jgi:hypothetical protein
MTKIETIYNTDFTANIGQDALIKKANYGEMNYGKVREISYPKENEIGYKTDNYYLCVVTIYDEETGNQISEHTEIWSL